MARLSYATIVVRLRVSFIGFKLQHFDPFRGENLKISLLTAAFFSTGEAGLYYRTFRSSYGKWSAEA